MKNKKHIIIPAALLFALQSESKAQNFGRYADCTTGRGLCGIIVENIQAEQRVTDTTQKFWLQSKTDSTLLLKISRSNITPEDEYKIFGAPLASFQKDEPVYFHLDAAVPVEPALVKMLGLPEKTTTIKAGSYLLERTAPYFITELKLL